MFPPSPWSVESTEQWCQSIYGPLLDLRPDALPMAFGLWDLSRFVSSVSRLIFSSGTVRTSCRIFAPEYKYLVWLQSLKLLESIFSFEIHLQYDPWMTQSINVTLSPSLPAVVIVGGAHHSDLGGPQNPVPSPNDSASLIAARQFEIDTLNTWLHEWKEERKATQAARSSEASFRF